MVRLKITAKGQVTLRKDIRAHLGVEIGDEVDVVLMPHGGVQLRPAKKALSKDALFGMFTHKGKVAHSLEEMNETIEAGWSGEVPY